MCPEIVNSKKHRVSFQYASIIKIEAFGRRIMDYYSKIQKAIDYIEDNLKEKITIEDLAKISIFSVFHFHRIFHAVVGEPVMEYIRKRRLSNAAQELLDPGKRITDIAYDYFFNSHDTFTRAFRRLYNISPGEYRKNKVQINLYERKDLMMQREICGLQGEYIMEPKIVLKDDFMVIGMETFVSKEEYINVLNNDIVNREADKVAEKFFWELKQNVHQTVNPNNEICYNYDCDGGYMNMVCVEVSNIDNIPEGMVGKVIPRNRYVVFSHDFNLTPDMITVKQLDENITKYAFGTWFPNSVYEPTDSYSFELYDVSRVKEGVTRVDLYIPVKPI